MSARVNSIGVKIPKRLGAERLLALLIALAGTSCSMLPASMEDAGYEIARGAKSKLFKDEEPASLPEWHSLPNVQIRKYVSAVGARVLQHSQVNNVAFEISDSPTVQAWAEVKGGLNSEARVFVTRGMLNSMTSEAELACLLGHEISHHEQALSQPHGSNHTKEVGIIAGVLIPESVGRLGVRQDLEDIATANYSKELETKADQGGALLCNRAGYDPTALPALLTRLARLSDNGVLAKIKNLKGSHVQLQTRSDHLREFIRGQKIIGGRTAADNFKQNLKALSSNRPQFPAGEQTILTEIASFKQEADRSFRQKSPLTAERFVQMTSRISQIIRENQISAADLRSVAEVRHDHSFMQERIVLPFSVLGSFLWSLRAEAFNALVALSRVGVGFIPAVGSSVDLYELMTGRDFFTGDSLSKADRTLSALGLAVGQGHNLRALEKTVLTGMRDTDGILQALRRAGRIEAELPRPRLGNRYVRDLPDLKTVNTSYAKEFDGAILKGPYEPGEILSQAQRSSQAQPGRWFSPVRPVNPQDADELLNIRKFGNDAGQIKMFRVKERVSGYSGKITDGGGHQFFIPDDVPLSEVLEEIAL